MAVVFCSFRSLLERPLASLPVFVADVLMDYWLLCFVLINGLQVFCFSDTKHAVLDSYLFEETGTRLVGTTDKARIPDW